MQQAQFAMPPFRGAVRALVLVSIAIFFVQLICEQLLHIPVDAIFGFIPAKLASGWIWQLFTYPFLHGGPMHLLFNLLVLWSLGAELESLWGAKSFLGFFFVCAIGAAVFYGLLSLFGVSPPGVPLLGSSGAIYGLLLAYGILFGDRVLYFFMLFPMPAKYFVMILGAIEFVSSVFYEPNGIAHSAHLGGMLTAFLYLMAMASWRRRSKKEFRGEQAAWEKKKKTRKASHLKLVTGEDDDSEKTPKHWH